LIGHGDIGASNFTAIPRNDMPSACIRRIRAMIFCSRAFSTSRPLGPKSQPNGAWPLIRSPRLRFTLIALRVRSRIMARSNSANTDAICAIARPYGLVIKAHPKDLCFFGLFKGRRAA
jgi:hypothetical protein